MIDNVALLVGGIQMGGNTGIIATFSDTSNPVKVGTTDFEGQRTVMIENLAELEVLQSPASPQSLVDSRTLEESISQIFNNQKTTSNSMLNTLKTWFAKYPVLVIAAVGAVLYFGYNKFVKGKKW